MPDASTDDQRLSRIFRSLADPSRRKIIALLRDTPELRVGDLASAFEMSLNGVSKHIKQLESAGLVSRRLEGTTHFIRLDPEGVAPVFDWLDVYRDRWQRRLDALESMLASDPDSARETQNSDHGDNDIDVDA